MCKSRKQEQLFRRALHARLVTALQRRLRRKAVAKLCEWPSSRCVSDSSRYIRSRAQYAAKWCVVVTVEPPKGAEGITRPDEASLSQHMAADTGCWRRTASGSVVFGLPRTTRLNEGGHGVRLAVLGSPLLYRSKAVHFCTLWTLVSIVSRCPPMTRWGRKEVAMFLLSDVTLVVLWSND